MGVVVRSKDAAGATGGATRAGAARSSRAARRSARTPEGPTGPAGGPTGAAERAARTDGRSSAATGIAARRVAHARATRIHGAPATRKQKDRREPKRFAVSNGEWAHSS